MDITVDDPVIPPDEDFPIKKRQEQADTTGAKPNSNTIDSVSAVMEVICNKLAVAAINQAGKVNGVEEFAAEMDKDVSEAIKQDQDKVTQLVEQAKNGKPSNSGSCTTGDHVKLVEWKVNEIPKDKIITFITDDGTTVEVEESIFFCDDLTHCHIQWGAIQADITFNYANTSAVESTTGNSTVQPDQLHRRGLPIEYNTLISSASPSLQHSSFRDSNTMTLTLTLMVILYMYVFNIKR